MSATQALTVAIILIASPAVAQPSRPHAQLETPLITTGNWPWESAWEWEHDFPYREDGGHPELITGTYINFSSPDQRYAVGINLKAQFRADLAEKAAAQAAKLWGQF
jgi:hypothetical protein